MSEEETRRYCERVFAVTLEGHGLVSNRSIWRNFPWVWNERWSYRNMVLIGDALHTAHYSIGSGTRLALEDALALVKALEAEPRDVRPGLDAVRGDTAPVVEKLVAASRRSARVVRAVRRAHAARAARAGHELHNPLAADRRRSLRAMSPGFMAQYAGRHRPATDRARKGGRTMPDDVSGLIDGVPRDAPGTREIGFSVPDRYNASAILFDNLMAASGYRCAVTGPAGLAYLCRACRRCRALWRRAPVAGLRRGDRVLLFLDDTPAYPAALFGAIRAGLVPLLINTLTPPDLLQFYLADSGARVADLRQRPSPSASTRGLPRHQTSGRYRHQRRGLPRPVLCARCRARAMAGDGRRAARRRRTRTATTWRSGCTRRARPGRPKGIVHLQHDMLYTHLSYARHVLRLKKATCASQCPKSFSLTASATRSPFRSRLEHRASCCPGSPSPRQSSRP